MSIGLIGISFIGRMDGSSAICFLGYFLSLLIKLERPLNRYSQLMVGRQVELIQGEVITLLIFSLDYLDYIICT